MQSRLQPAAERNAAILTVCAGCLTVA